MSEDEKKFRLDELPDEGSIPLHKNPPEKRFREIEKADPRVSTLKEKSEEEQATAMARSWSFDEPEKLYGWMIYIGVLLAIQFGPLYQLYQKELNSFDNDFLPGKAIVEEFTIYIDFLVRYPIIFIIFTPFFFHFTRASEYAFEITFDGIRTVKKYLPIGSTEIVTPVFIKWKQIEKVEKKIVNGKDILSFYAIDGSHIADLIWYISIEKKRAVKVLLNGTVVPKHPLRSYLDNEKELK